MKQCLLYLHFEQKYFQFRSSVCMVWVKKNVRLGSCPCVGCAPFQKRSGCLVREVTRLLLVMHSTRSSTVLWTHHLLLARQNLAAREKKVRKGHALTSS